ncbi:MAG: S8 family serine peptidase [Caldilineae bacterium]|nr:S8 family serine peptidase [Caldilineae bacterium]
MRQAKIVRRSWLLIPAFLLTRSPGGIQPGAAQGGPELAGAGVVVAIVGSGVDYGHAALGGSGDRQAYATNDPTLLEAGSFPTQRVIGGWDLAGERYASTCPEVPAADMRCSAVPEPDPDPLDGPGGSGTRMAGIVSAVAPGAQLVVLKVRGQPIGMPSTSRLYDEAIDWVLRHNAGQSVPGAPADGQRIAIVLLEPGEGQGAGRSALEAAVTRAGETGVAVIAAIGDGGATPYGAAGNAAPPGVLSVGAEIDQAPRTWGIRASWTGPDGQPTSESFDALEAEDWLPQLSATGPIEAELAWYGEACNADGGGPSEPAQPVDGRVALIARGTCPFTEKLVNAAARGARAALVYSDDRPKVAMPCGGGACPVAPGIPGVMIDRAPGQALRAQLEAGRTLQVSLDASYAIEMTWLAGTLVERSGAGPAVGGGLAPDLVAGGYAVPAPIAGGGDDTTVWTSSEAAAARLAGMAALVQARANAAGWSGEGLDHALVSTLLASHARPDLRLGRSDTGPLAPVSRQGAGRADLESTLSARLLAHAPIGQGLDFGIVRVSGVHQLRESLVLRRLDDRAASLRASFEPVHAGFAGASVSVGSQALTFGDRALIERGISVQLDPAGLDDWDVAPGEALADPDALARHTLDGHLRLRELDESGATLPDGETLSVPLQLIARRSSCVEPALMSGPDASGRADARFENRCVTRGRLRAVPLVGLDPEESDSQRDPRLRALDLRAVGLRYGRLASGEGVLEVHVATAGTRSSPVGTTVEALLDLDLDGRFDRVLASVPGSALREGSADRWYTVNAPLLPGSLEPDLASAAPRSYPLAYELGEAVSVLRANSDDLLLDFESGQERFGLAVRLRDTLGLAPSGQVLPTYDLAPDGLLQGAAFVVDQTAQACLSLEVPGGAMADGLDQDLNVEADGGAVVLAVKRQVGCKARLDDGPYGYLIAYPDNAEAQEQAETWILWQRASPEPIFLPYGSRGTATGP